MHTIRLAGGPAFGCADGDTVLRAGLREGLGLSYECNVGSCGVCKFELVEGAVEDLRPDAPGLSERDRRKGRRLACQSRPTADCVVSMRLDDAVRPPVRPQQRTAVLEAVRPLTQDMSEFTVRTDGAADFLPGQYALLHLPGLGTPRAYSMANTPNPQGIWQFIVRRVPNGAGTAALFAMTPGAALSLDAPYGQAYLRPSGRDVVCVAGGSGLAPMLSIARAFAEGPADDRRLTLYYGARTARDVCGEAELATLPGFGTRIRYVPAVSDPDDGFAGRRGFIHTVMAEDLGRRFDNCDIYCAGPPPMTLALEDLLIREAGIPADRLRFDRFF